MGVTIFIGDALTASGFRLAGIEIMTPAYDEASGAFDEARARAGILLITADLARCLPRRQLESALAAETPLVAVIPDVLGKIQPPDLDKSLKAILGIEI